MRLSVCLFFPLVFLVATGQGQDDVRVRVEADLPALVSIYEDLHAHPELSYREKETSRRLAAELRSLGFRVAEDVGIYSAGERAEGVVGVLENGSGPTVMIRTDMDALPVTERTGLPYASEVQVDMETGGRSGVMHACGHDMHMAVWLGVARLLTRLKEEWSGTLVLIGQPAEEMGAGAEAMLNDGLYERFPRPDYVLAYHVSDRLPAGTVGFRPGAAFAAVNSLDIVVRGEGGHGAYPHTTKDPIVIASQLVLNLQTIVSRIVPALESAVVTVGSFHGGTKRNIIPDSVQLQLTVRTYEPEVRERVLESIRTIARGTGMAAGLSEDLLPVVEVADGSPSVYNDPDLTETLAGVLRRELGEDSVREVDPVMVSEDFALYTLEKRQIPTSMLWLGVVPRQKWEKAEAGEIELPSLHSSQFAPEAESALAAGVRGMTAGALELFRRGAAR